MTMARLSKPIISALAVATLFGSASIWPASRRFEGAATDGTSVSASESAPLLSAKTRTLAEQAIAKYAAARPLRVSDHFHRWRFDSLIGPYSQNSTLQRELRELRDKGNFRRTFPGSPPLFFRSPYGWDVRQRTPKSMEDHWQYEHHVDQFLASCAETGVPLSLTIETDFAPVSVGELLEASRRSFETSQELCWTLVAYCTYLPNEPEWQNRFGESCSYESMIENLLSQSLSSGSCGGTHKQYAIACYLGSPAIAHSSSSLCKRCEDYLRQSSRLLEQSQLPSGAWDPGWAGSPSETPDSKDSSPIRGVDLVRITGHQLEWILVAPKSCRPSSTCSAQALRFLAEILSQADATSIHKDYCAYSHAACVLQRTLLSDSQVAGKFPNATQNKN
jgi:hypothetical protein